MMDKPIVRILAVVLVLAASWFCSGCYIHRTFVAQYEPKGDLPNSMLRSAYAFDINNEVKHAHDKAYLARHEADTAEIRWLSTLGNCPYDKDMWYLHISIGWGPIDYSGPQKIIADTVRLRLNNYTVNGDDITALVNCHFSVNNMVIYPIIIPKSHDGPFYIYVVLGLYQEGATEPTERIPLTIKCERKTKVRFGD